MLALKPDFQTFCKLAKKGNLIPVFAEYIADTQTPVGAALALNEEESIFLLESVEGGEKWGDYSFLGIRPKAIFSCKDGEVQILQGKKISVSQKSKNPLHELKKYLKSFKPVTVPGIPRFHGGAVGYLAYDCIRFFENLPLNNPDDLDLPDALFMITDLLIVFHQFRQTIQIIANVQVDKNASKATLEKAYQKAKRDIQAIKRKLDAAPSLKNKTKSTAIKTIDKLLVPKSTFIQQVERAKKYIQEGDIIQVVLSNRLQGKTKAKPLQIYRALRLINPSPYMYYFRYGEFSIVGSSPETLVRLENKKITIRPIAGTRPRGKDEFEDENLAIDLLADPKEKAEHIMLVDLGRNDIGRIAEKGSVHVDQLMKVERYSHVMHIVSNIQATLAKGKTAFDVLEATFPAGTLTGAPKIRAMQIIEELETVCRGPYGGALGYFDFSGNMDFCITIRTLMMQGNDFCLQAGAGIVADSIPDQEYQECMNKAKALRKAIDLAGKI